MKKMREVAKSDTNSNVFIRACETHSGQHKAAPGRGRKQRRSSGERSTHIDVGHDPGMNDGHCMHSNQHGSCHSCDGQRASADADDNTEQRTKSRRSVLQRSPKNTASSPIMPTRNSSTLSARERPRERHRERVCETGPTAHTYTEAQTLCALFICENHACA